MPSSTSAPGVWKIKEIANFIQDDSWPSIGDRACFAGGDIDSYSNVIDFVQISSDGNATDFGDLTEARQIGAQNVASNVRGCFAGGYGPSAETDTIDYITIKTTGNATDFGDLTVAKDNSSGAGSSTRALFGGGGTGTRPTRPPTDNIDYITIASTGNATDFGNLTSETTIMGQGTNKIRALFAGGQGAAPGYTKQNKIDKVTIASTGNATDFGDLTVTRRGIGSANNFHGGI